MMELKKRRNAYLMFLLLCLVAAAAIAGMSALLYQSSTSEQGVAEGSENAGNENDGEIADSGNGSSGKQADNTADTGDTVLRDSANGTDDGTQTADGENGELTDASDAAGSSGDLADASDSQDPEGAGGGNASNMADATDDTGEDAGDSLAAAGQVRELLAEKIAAYSFDAGKITWPVEGEVCLEYNMQHTIYYATLDLYRCNPGVCICAEAGTEVLAGVDGVVTGIAEDNFYGTMVTIAIGDDYEVTYGQLADVGVAVGDEVTASTQIGTVAEPTIYFTEEGAHLFLEITESGETLDPLDYLNY